MGSTASREHRSAAQRRDALLDATVQLMRVGGVRAATARTVTQQAGMPLGSFHYYFASRDSLLAALLEREIRRSLLASWDEVAAAGDPRADLESAFISYLDHLAADPGYQLLIHELILVVARQDPSASARVRTLVIQAVADMYTQWGRRAGLTWDLPVEVLAGLTVATASGIAISWLTTRDDEAAQAAGRAAAAFIAARLVPEPPAGADR